MRTRGRVLILDTSAELIASLSDLLEGEGYVAEAHFVSELRKDVGFAQKVLQSFDPDVILFDVAPPLDEAWQSLRLFEALPECKERPLIVMSTSREQLPDLAKERPSLEYVLKPFDVKELLQLVAVATGRLADEAIWQRWFSGKRRPS